MKKAVWLLGMLALVTTGFGCNGKPGDQPIRASKAGQNTKGASDKDLALMFLRGVQGGDKSQMYDAANLTPDLVSSSREKLIHAAQYKQTERQRQESEHALRASGNIDFFFSKMKKMLPKSAVVEITEAKAEGLTTETRELAHAVKITYGNKAEAMTDKTGRPIKSMVIHLRQTSKSVNDRWINEFSLTSRDFDKMAEKEFEAVSYF